MAPTPVWMTFTRTSSVPSFSRDVRSASTVPWTSALIMTGSSLTSPCLMRSYKSSKLVRAVPRSCSPARCLRRSPRFPGRSGRRAPRRPLPPRRGASLRPSTSTGVDGPASCSDSPRWSNMARTRPLAAARHDGVADPQRPFWIRTVATGPRPGPVPASMTMPRARRFGIRLQLLHVRDEQDHLQQLVHALPCFSAETGTSPCRRPTLREPSRARVKLLVAPGPCWLGASPSC